MRIVNLIQVFVRAYNIRVQNMKRKTILLHNYTTSFADVQKINLTAA